MKKAFLAIIAVICLAFTANAQPEKPAAGAKGLGFKLTGINDIMTKHWASGPTGVLSSNNMLFGRYYLSDNMALRIGFGINSVSWKSTYDEPDADSSASNTNSIKSETTKKQFGFSIAPGIEYHFATETRVDPYVGGEIMIGMLGKSTTTTDSTNNNTATGGTTHTSKVEKTMGGGMMFGVGAVVGFNYFLSDHFALGAEYTWGFMSQSNGGDVEETTSATNGSVGGTSTSSNTTRTYESKTSTSGLRVGGTGNVHLSIFW